MAIKCCIASAKLHCSKIVGDFDGDFGSHSCCSCSHSICSRGRQVVHCCNVLCLRVQRAGTSDCRAVPSSGKSYWTA